MGEPIRTRACHDFLVTLAYAGSNRVLSQEIKRYCADAKDQDRFVEPRKTCTSHAYFLEGCLAKDEVVLATNYTRGLEPATAIVRALKRVIHGREKRVCETYTVWQPRVWCTLKEFLEDDCGGTAVTYEVCVNTTPRK